MHWQAVCAHAIVYLDHGELEISSPVGDHKNYRHTRTYTPMPLIKMQIHGDTREYTPAPRT